jgi:hypothetical protein
MFPHITDVFPGLIPPYDAIEPVDGRAHTRR